MQKNDEAPAHELMRSLLHEVFQAEQSGARHPPIEAERAPGTPPAAAMQRIAEHAARSLAELRALAGALVPPGPGQTVGAAFSVVRKYFADRVISKERSYRGTLLGLRHGLDALAALQQAAGAAGALDLAALCQRVIAERQPLLDAVAAEVAWFSQHPEIAMAPAEEGALARGVHALGKAFSAA